MPESTLEEKIAGLEGSYRELTKRIDDLRAETHRSLDGVKAEVSALRLDLKAEISELRSEFRTSFRWTMSLVVVNWLSLMAGIFLIARR